MKPIRSFPILPIALTILINVETISHICNLICKELIWAYAYERRTQWVQNYETCIRETRISTTWRDVAELFFRGYALTSRWCIMNHSVVWQLIRQGGRLLNSLSFLKRACWSLIQLSLYPFTIHDISIFFILRTSRYRITIFTRLSPVKCHEVLT